MSNMSYCRMENTYKDLQDCLDNWDETDSESELKYRENLLELCREIIGTFDEEYELVKVGE